MPVWDLNRLTELIGTSSSSAIFNFFDQLHPGHQISGGSDAAHAACKNMGNVHAKRVADANLQTIRLTDLHKGF